MLVYHLTHFESSASFTPNDLTTFSILANLISIPSKSIPRVLKPGLEFCAKHSLHHLHFQVWTCSNTKEPLLRGKLVCEKTISTSQPNSVEIVLLI